jgi:hypothetical protein
METVKSVRYRPWFATGPVAVEKIGKENSAMHRLNFSHAMIAAAALSLATAAAAQQTQPAPDPYQGVSQPPTGPILTTQDAPAAKPQAGVVATVTVGPQQPQPTSPGPVQGPVQGPVASYSSPVPTSAPPPEPLYTRPADPDGDIVHPLPAQPGELLAGATIRVRLMDRISSSETEKGEPFRGQVVADVVQYGQVLIPAGASIEGRVSAVSAGHFGGHGSFRLRPEAVILPDGSRFQLHAETMAAPGSKARIGSEGTVNPGSRAKRDGVEYGAVVGTGVVAGAVIGGPVGALTGGLIGAGVVTTHLMVDHPQATLEPGAILLFSTTEPMNLLPAQN